MFPGPPYKAKRHENQSFRYSTDSFNVIGYTSWYHGCYRAVISVGILAQNNSITVKMCSCNQINILSWTNTNTRSFQWYVTGKVIIEVVSLDADVVPCGSGSAPNR